MNANAKKWVRALRSGKFKQGVGQLRQLNAPEFCCLGVACELAKKAGVIKTYKPSDGGLPEKVRVWLGLDTNDGEFRGRNKTGPKTHQTSLVRLNDTLKNTFEEIADVIESEPEGLFRK